jgi:Fe-S oxidoreductase
MFFTDEERKLTIQGCRFCPMCFHADAVAGITCKESHSPRGRGLILFGLESGVLKWDDPMVADVLYKSFTDGLPQEWCAGHCDRDELVIEARHRLVEKGLAPDEVARAVSRIVAAGSPYAEPPTGMGELLAKAGVAATPGAELLVFAGCASRSLYPLSPISFLKILKARGVPFTLLDPEPCCGMTLYQLGDFNHAAQQAKAVTQRIADSRAREVVLLDPDCFRMFTTRFARFGAKLPGGLKVSHASEWLSLSMEAEKWPLAKRTETFTYHDPSSLARFTGLHEPARAILGAIFGREPREMLGNRGKAFCCGEGGGMLLTNPEIAREAAARRYAQARMIGADLLITSSPACAGLLSQVKTGGPLVKDLVEIVEEAIR